MKRKHLLSVAVVGFAGSLSACLLILGSGLLPVGRADCDPAVCSTPPCCNGDVNGDRAIDLTDAVYILSFLFLGGDAPEAFACCDTLESRMADLEASTSGLEFGRKIAGVYAGVANFEGNPVFGLLARIDPFGGFSSTVTSAFTSVNNYESPSLGTWRRTGELEITATIVAYQYDEMEQLKAVVKSIAVVNLDPEFNSFDCTLTSSGFEQTGLTDLGFVECDATPENSGVYTISGRRVCAAE